MRLFAAAEAERALTLALYGGNARADGDAIAARGRTILEHLGVLNEAPHHVAVVALQLCRREKLDIELPQHALLALDLGAVRDDASGALGNLIYQVVAVAVVMKQMLAAQHAAWGHVAGVVTNAAIGA